MASLLSRRGIAQTQLMLNKLVLQLDSRADEASLYSRDLQSTVGTARPGTCTSQILTSNANPREAGQSAHSPICQMGYDVHGILGRGSMATVYKVVRCSDRTEFAAKCVKGIGENRHNSAVVEFDIMKDLNHENILKAEAFFKFKTETWLCTELCPEGDVHSYVMNHGVLAEGHCRSLARQLVSGTHHLHSKRVVHRDIKPQNLFLGHGALQLKIGDFNSARVIGTTAAKNDAVWMLSMRGTPLYSAPELQFDLPWNERVDIWAVGLSVYFMARAALPFNASSRRAIESLREGKVPHIPWRGMPALVADLVRHCLTIDMRDRPTGMELQFHPALKATSGGQGSEAAEIKPKRCRSGSGSTLQCSSGLLFSSTSSPVLRPEAKESWRETAWRALALESLPTLEKLSSFGPADPWIV